jgi:hypothetical protein
MPGANVYPFLVYTVGLVFPVISIIALYIFIEGEAD